MLPRRGELPSSDYSASDVAKICLKALQSNDYPQLDHGACVVLEFKSPGGPISVFTNPAELGSYFRKVNPHLVDFKSVQFIDEPVKVVSNVPMVECVQIRVGIVPWDLPTEIYSFYLSKIDKTWLIDAIAKIESI